MKIFGWLADNSGCGYYRIRLPFEQLAAQGHDASYSTDMPVAVARGEADVIVGQRVFLGQPSTTWQRLAKQGKSKLVYEIDDDLTAIDWWNHAAHGFHQNGTQERIIANIEVADLVTVSTEALADVVSKWNRNVAVLPNCIPAWTLDHRPPQHAGRVTIGWAGSASHSEDFAECSAYLKRTVARGGAEFHCIGEDYRSGWQHSRFTEWFAGVEDYLRGIDFHIGLCPLRPSEFNRSKSAIKLLELSALGIPAVVSRVGPYEAAIEDGSPAIGVRQPHEWATALRELVTDRDLRTELGAQARAWAAKQTIEDNAWRWAEAYEGGPDAARQ